MACSSEADFFIMRPVMDVFRYVSSMPAIANIRVNSVDPYKFQIYLSVGASFTSWGEKITICFFDPLNGGTRIIVNSTSSLPTTLIDYGKNRQNADAIKQHIVSLLVN